MALRYLPSVEGEVERLVDIGQGDILVPYAQITAARVAKAVCRQVATLLQDGNQSHPGWKEIAPIFTPLGEYEGQVVGTGVIAANTGEYYRVDATYPVGKPKSPTYLSIREIDETTNQYANDPLVLAGQPKIFRYNENPNPDLYYTAADAPTRFEPHIKVLPAAQLTDLVQKFVTPPAQV